jgi:hypothetical protein
MSFKKILFQIIIRANYLKQNMRYYNVIKIIDKLKIKNDFIFNYQDFLSRGVGLADETSATAISYGWC